MLQLQLDILADQPAQQQVRDSASTSVNVSTRGCRVCWREKARSWRTRLAARLAFCLICMMSAKDGSPGAVAQQQQVAEADHRRQQIVEVVRDAAGELAHRLEPQGLGELGLEAAAVGLGGQRPDRQRADGLGGAFQGLNQRAERGLGAAFGGDVPAQP